LPYLTADVRFELSRHENALIVPNAALRWTPTLEQVVPEVRPAFDTQAATTPQEQAAGIAASQPTEGAGDQERQGVLWTPEGRFVRPVFVRIGPTDDIMTQVQGEGLTENLPVVTGQIEIGAASRSAAGSNPFLPKPPKGGRRGPPPPM